MKVKACSTIGLLLALLVIPSAAQGASRETCRAAIHDEFAREHRLYRSVILGQRPAEDAAIGEVRYDTDGDAWYKFNDSSTPWRSLAEGSIGLEWSNSLMDSESQVPPRKGLFETRRTTTSELVPYLTESMRAYQCRLNTICSAVRMSKNLGDATPQTITPAVYGCIEVDRETILGCHLAAGEPGKRGSTEEELDIERYCERAAAHVLEQEAETLKLLVEYDAAYRTMLQLAGNVELFLEEFKSPLLNSLRQTVNLLGSLNRIPCFLSSCDASPPTAP